MSLTKEECLRALNCMEKISCRECGIKNRNCFSKCIEEHYTTLEQLINEHFELVNKYNKLKERHMKLLSQWWESENQPLKFEELKPNMWVWDNDYKLYCLIDIIYSFNKFSVNYHFNTMQEFEENRFYRREVKDNEH